MFSVSRTLFWSGLKIRSAAWRIFRGRKISYPLPDFTRDPGLSGIPVSIATFRLESPKWRLARNFDVRRKIPLAACESQSKVGSWTEGLPLGAEDLRFRSQWKRSVGSAQHLSVGSEHFPVRTKSINAGHYCRIVGSNCRWERVRNFEAKSSFALGKVKIWQVGPTLAKSDLFISGKTYRENGVISSSEVVERTAGFVAKSRTFDALCYA